METGNVDAVLDGGLDIFINGYLKWISVQGDKKNNRELNKFKFVNDNIPEGVKAFWNCVIF